MVGFLKKLCPKTLFCSCTIKPPPPLRCQQLGLKILSFLSIPLYSLVVLGLLAPLGAQSIPYKGILFKVEYSFEAQTDQLVPLSYILGRAMEGGEEKLRAPLPSHREEIGAFAKANRLSICIWQNDPPETRPKAPLSLVYKGIFSRGKQAAIHLLMHPSSSHLFVPLRIVPQKDPKIDSMKALEICLRSFEMRQKVEEGPLGQLESLATSSPSNTSYIMTLANINHFGLGRHPVESADTYLQENRWLELGAQQEVPEAMCSLAINYLNGHGLGRNLEKACGLFDAAGGKGYKYALRLLDSVRARQASSFLPRLSGDSLRSVSPHVRWMLDAAQRGNPTAKACCTQIGALFLDASRGEESSYDRREEREPSPAEGKRRRRAISHATGLVAERKSIPLIRMVSSPEPGLHPLYGSSDALDALPDARDALLGGGPSSRSSLGRVYHGAEGVASQDSLLNESSLRSFSQESEDSAYPYSQNSMPLEGSQRFMAEGDHTISPSLSRSLALLTSSPTEAARKARIQLMPPSFPAADNEKNAAS